MRCSWCSERPRTRPFAVPREESCAPCCLGPRAPRNLRTTRERCQHMIQPRSWTPRGRNMPVRGGRTVTRARPCSRGVTSLETLLHPVGCAQQCKRSARAFQLRCISGCSVGAALVGAVRHCADVERGDTLDTKQRAVSDRIHKSPTREKHGGK